MNIQLDPEMMQSVVSDAILKTLPQDKRDALIQGAIQLLLTPASTSYGRSKSPIEEAFEYAVKAVATKQAEEILTANEEVKTKINQLILEALARVMETNREQTVSKLADAIVSGMAYKERY